MKNELKYGLLLFAITVTLYHFGMLPHILTGFFFALSICLEVIGALPERTYQRMKCRKEREYVNEDSDSGTA